ncbi:MAG: protein-disulfide reductase DsbD [Methylosarcina sp.]
MRKLSIPIVLFSLLFWLADTALAVDEGELLEPDAAFRLTYAVKNSNTLTFTWDIADGYYLYRDKIQWVSLTPTIETDAPSFPATELKHDQNFGDVQIYRGKLSIELPILRQDPKIQKVVIETAYQGCSEANAICYLPLRKTAVFDLTEASLSGAVKDVFSGSPPPFVSEQDRIAKLFAGSSVGLVMLSFLGFGLMLAFTPCVFPMIPIVSGIVVGDGEGLTTRRAFGLSLCYVIAAAGTYTAFGVLTGLFGKNLQAFFQQPAVIVGISVIFLALALSIFGVFTFQVPAFVQNKLGSVSSRQRRGNWLGAAVMGMLSALTIGPCVTAPLAGALIYIGKTGDAVLGGLALFALGFGMGIPLLVIGTSAGKLMPRAGAWMQMTKTVFGVSFLAVAIWLLGRILPLPVTLALWGLLLLIPLMYLGWRKLWKMAAGLAFVYGILLIAGGATRPQRDYMALLCEVAVACREQPSLAFKPIDTMGELRQSLAEIRQNDRWVMLEFYADWCISCQELQRTTFAEAGVQAALANFTLLQADVTAEYAPARSLLRHFDLIGPPAILFFGPDQRERESYRIVGYLDDKKFLAQLREMMR